MSTCAVSTLSFPDRGVTVCAVGKRQIEQRVCQQFCDRLGQAYAAFSVMCAGIPELEATSVPAADPLG